MVACIHDGTVRKANKTPLNNTLEKPSSAVEEIPENSAFIIDAMGLVQRIKGNHTFRDVAETLYRAIMAQRGCSNRIDVVFDVYREKSIKNAERKSRGNTGSPIYKCILPNHRINQWKQFIKRSENKANLIRFLCKEWKGDHFRSRLEGCKMYLGYDEICFMLSEQSVDIAENLNSNHEEADSRLFLHAKNVVSTKEAIVIVCEDTDVFVLGVANAGVINIPLYMKRGSQSKTRFVNLTEISNVLGPDVSSCLPGMHAFTRFGQSLCRKRKSICSEAFTQILCFPRGFCQHGTTKCNLCWIVETTRGIHVFTLWFKNNNGYQPIALCHALRETRKNWIASAPTL